MSGFSRVLLSLLAMFAIGGSAQAAEVWCGNLLQGIRMTIVDPGLRNGLCLTGTGNLGDTELEALAQIDTVIERDSGNSNGGLLSVTGIGKDDGTWSFNGSVWSEYERLFLYFHFGNAEGFGWLGNPDWFIVELAPNDTYGSWELETLILGKTTGLSNVGLLGSGQGTPPPAGIVSEPAAIALAGLALLALGALSRRRGTRK